MILGASNMLFRQGILVCLLLLGVLTGCALSPQQISPNPVLTANFSSVGQGQAINVRVVDSRANNVLGTRGGVYSTTSNITVNSADMVPKLQAQAESVLTKMGYKPTSSGAENSLIISVAELVYKAPDSSRKVDVAAVLKSELRTASKTFNGRYSASKHQEFASAPNITDNTQLVTEVLVDALTRLLKDSQLTGAM